MKKTIATLAIAATSLLASTPDAEAGTKGDILRFVGQQIVKNHHVSYGYNQGHCTPYLVRTAEVCRRCETRTGYRPCGTVYYYTVTVVTYRDFYSNGSTRTYTRVFA